MDDKLDLDELEKMLARPLYKEADDSLVLDLHKGQVVALPSAARQRAGEEVERNMVQDSCGSGAGIIQ